MQSNLDKYIDYALDWISNRRFVSDEVNEDYQNTLDLYWDVLTEKEKLLSKTYRMNEINEALDREDTYE